MKITVLITIVILISLFIFFWVVKPSPERVSLKSLDLSSLPENAQISYKQEALMNFFEFVCIEMDTEDIKGFFMNNPNLGDRETDNESVWFHTYLSRFSWFEPQKLTDILYRIIKVLRRNGNENLMLCTGEK